MENLDVRLTVNVLSLLHADQPAAGAPGHPSDVVRRRVAARTDPFDREGPACPRS
jgi:hypothetical protein